MSGASIQDIFRILLLTREGSRRPAGDATHLQLTRYSDYSLRLLIYLALAPERLVTVEEIARSYGV